MHAHASHLIPHKKPTTSEHASFLLSLALTNKIGALLFGAAGQVKVKSEP
jgi:hypothetical protein